MKKMINTVTLAGPIYSYDLKEGAFKSGDRAGQKYIMGTLNVATDDACVNVVPVRYFTGELTKKGTVSQTYTTLKNIMESNNTVLEVGDKNAILVEVTASMELNDFVGQDGEIVSPKRVSGMFVNVIDTLQKIKHRNIFALDMVITSALRIEADEEKGTEEYVKLHGAAFGYGNKLLPLDLVVRSANGMNYFEDKEPTSKEPFFTKVWGEIVNETTYIEEKEEVAFGEAVVTLKPRSKSEWLVTSTARVPYDFGDEDVLTGEELTQAKQNRDVYLATVKSRDEEYKASKGGAGATKAATPATQLYTF